MSIPSLFLPPFSISNPSAKQIPQEHGLWSPPEGARDKLVLTPQKPSAGTRLMEQALHTTARASFENLVIALVGKRKPENQLAQECTLLDQILTNNLAVSPISSLCIFVKLCLII